MITQFPLPNVCLASFAGERVLQCTDSNHDNSWLPNASSEKDSFGPIHLQLPEVKAPSSYIPAKPVREKRDVRSRICAWLAEAEAFATYGQVVYPAFIPLEGLTGPLHNGNEAKGMPLRHILESRRLGFGAAPTWPATTSKGNA
jgi:hypothetical protein